MVQVLDGKMLKFTFFWSVFPSNTYDILAKCCYINKYCMTRGRKRNFSVTRGRNYRPLNFIDCVNVERQMNQFHNFRAIFHSSSCFFRICRKLSGMEKTKIQSFLTVYIYRPLLKVTDGILINKSNYSRLFFKMY